MCANARARPAIPLARPTTLAAAGGYPILAASRGALMAWTYDPPDN
eukprot:gene5162-9785_t